MEKLTNIIEAILFASGKPVACSDICEKLSLTSRELKKALEELKEKYGEEGGIRLLEFNKKVQLASNPIYKSEVEAVLNPIREKELTRTILECVAIIAYKQPITRTEIESFRGCNSDYAVNVLLELKLIEPCGRKDAVGHPILFGTTDEFLKRFRLRSLADLPDYDKLMNAIKRDDDRDSYLYARDEYAEGQEAKADETAEGQGKPTEKPKKSKKKAKADSETAESDEAPTPDSGEKTEGGYEIQDFLRGLDDADIIKIS